MQLGIHPGPVVVFHRSADAGIQRGQPVQHPALQFRHVGQLDTFRFVEAGQAAEHPTQRVAQAAIQLGGLLEDFAADAQVLAGVRHHHPEAQNVDAVLLRHLFRRDDVAERFRHLAALLVHHEAIGQDCLEWRPSPRADGFEQRRLEPAAMLVGAFQVQVGRPGQVAPFQHERMGRAGFEPHVHDVHDLFVVVRIASRRGWPVFFSTNTAIGTPQARWRLMHQSGRPATIEPMRLRPWSGTNCVASIAASAFLRICSGPSRRMNHCGVARKISGALERQECG